LEKEGITIPVIVGGAAVSKKFADKRLHNNFSFPVYYIKDAAECPAAIDNIISNKDNEEDSKKYCSKLIFTNNKKNIKYNHKSEAEVTFVEPEEVHQYFNKKLFNRFWRINTKKQAFTNLVEEAETAFNNINSNNFLQYKAVTGIYDIENISEGNVTFKTNESQKSIDFSLPDGSHGLAGKIDTIKTKKLGMFALTVTPDKDFLDSLDIYEHHLVHSIVCTEADAFSDYLSLHLKDTWFEGKKPDNPAPGYKSCPDHELKRKIFDTLNAEEIIGVQLTENYAMLPQSSISGFYIVED
jgi:5-methyltetrahydrofolate--homocysteine methyltransferase